MSQADYLYCYFACFYLSSYYFVFIQPILIACTSFDTFILYHLEGWNDLFGGAYEFNGCIESSYAL